MMCDVPTMAGFFIGNLLSVVLVLFPDIFVNLLTIPVAPMITGIIIIIIIIIIFVNKNLR
jgi:hypothetical protein